MPLLFLPADPTDRDILQRIVVHLDAGGLLAYPTETVYGFGATVDPEGVRRVVELKGREENKPMLVLLPEFRPAGLEGNSLTRGPGDDGSYDDRGDGLHWTPAAQRLAESFWPGPLTLVLSDPEARFPRGVRSAEGGVAVRVSPHPFVRALLELWGRPLLSTSANRPGYRPAKTAQEAARAAEGRPGLQKLWIADGGPLLTSDPSTVVDCTGDRPTLIRSGPISRESLHHVVPEFDDRA